MSTALFYGRSARAHLPVKKGIALIVQSGMMAANLVMNQRSVPFSYYLRR